MFKIKPKKIRKPQVVPGPKPLEAGVDFPALIMDIKVEGEETTTFARFPENVGLSATLLSMVNAIGNFPSEDYEEGTIPALAFKMQSITYLMYNLAKEGGLRKTVKGGNVSWSVASEVAK